MTLAQFLNSIAQWGDLYEGYTAAKLRKELILYLLHLDPYWLTRAQQATGLGQGEIMERLKEQMMNTKPPYEPDEDEDENPYPDGRDCSVPRFGL